jgi:predicted phosphoribosyltransferase
MRVNSQSDAKATTDFRFRNREEAGRLLGRKLERFRDVPGVLVLGLPRGGVPVAFPVAIALNAALDILLVRKLGVPGQDELAMGAIASNGIQILNNSVIQYLGIPESVVEEVTKREVEELSRREREYRGVRPPMDIPGKIAIVIDDGLATGSTMKAAIAALRCQAPAKIIVAVPTASPETCEELNSTADEVVCAITPEPFYAVGFSYDDFEQTTDDEVRALIQRAARR